MNLKKIITEKAEEIGIDIIGFADAEPFHDLKEFLLLRQKNEYDTEFEEKKIELRVNPQMIMEESKSIIVIGVSYNIDDKCDAFNENYGNKKSTTGHLSKSTWGIDYHVILKEKLVRLAEEIKKIIDFKYKIFVDTGPLNDREIAKRAGIGWYGKNNSIINDKFGSFIFLGYMLTDLEIKFDNHIENKCGNCSICIDSCPTGAIEGGYRINARRCISYLTQTKERIPYELREKMGVMIYGCDTCQLVCPKNKNVTKGKSECFIPKITRGRIDITELFNISNKEFKKKYGHMSGSWRGKNIFKRNCIIAMGNMKDKEKLDLLISGLKDDSSMIREYSAWALLKIDKELGKELIDKHITVEKNEEVKIEMLKLLKWAEGVDV